MKILWVEVRLFHLFLKHLDSAPFREKSIHLQTSRQELIKLFFVFQHFYCSFVCEALCSVFLHEMCCTNKVPLLSSITSVFTLVWWLVWLDYCQSSDLILTKWRPSQIWCQSRFKGDIFFNDFSTLHVFSIFVHFFKSETPISREKKYLYLYHDRLSIGAILSL